jgi:hypothetical protein
MDHRFTIRFNDLKDSYPIWDQWNMADNELDVTYIVFEGRACISSVRWERNEIIGLLMCLPKQVMQFIEQAAEGDRESRKQARIKAANMQPSTDQILKLK